MRRGCAIAPGVWLPGVWLPGHGLSLGGIGGSAAERARGDILLTILALPKETKMPRRARAPSEMSTVLLPMPSMTAWQPTPSVTWCQAWCHVGLGQKREREKEGRVERRWSKGWDCMQSSAAVAVVVVAVGACVSLSHLHDALDDVDGLVVLVRGARHLGQHDQLVDAARLAHRLLACARARARRAEPR